MEIAGWLFCLTALCYGLLSPYLTIPVMKVFSLLIFCFKIGSAVYLLGAALRAVRQQVPQAAPLFFAAAFYATLLLWDRLLPAFEPVVTGWFGEWGSFAMTLTIGYVLWRDIVSAYRFNLAFAAEYRQMERQLAMQVEYADQLAQRSDENRRLIHDFRQHLRTITELAGQIESRPETEEHRRELLRYLEDFPSVLARRPGVSPGSFCNRAPVDALLQYYSAATQRQEIRADLALTIPAGVPLGDVEWCTVLGNLLENALDGAGTMPQGKRRARIICQLNGEMCCVIVENSYNGQVLCKDGRFLSTKHEGRGHGLASVEAVVARHHGSMEVDAEGGIFRVSLLISLAPEGENP